MNTLIVVVVVVAVLVLLTLALSVRIVRQYELGTGSPGRGACRQGGDRPGGISPVDRGRPSLRGEGDAAAVLRWPARWGSPGVPGP